MASRTASIAEAVKVSLNTAAADPETFGATFTAQRVYVPAFDLNKTRGLQVQVYAANDEQSALTRAAKKHEIRIEVWIQKPLSAAANPLTEAANAEIDALTELAERVADHFRGSFTAGPGRWVRTDLPAPDTGTLLQQRLFTALVVLFFLVHS